MASQERPEPVTKPLVLHYRSPFLSASETFIRTTVTSRERYRAAVLTHELMGEPRLPLDIPVHVEPYPFGRVLSVLGERSAAIRLRQSRIAVARALPLLQPDVIHAHFAVEGIAAWRPAERAGVPCVVTFYGFDATHLPRDRRWRRRLARMTRHATLVLAEGPHMRDRLLAFGSPPECTRLQPIPVRLESFPFRPPVARERATVIQACRFVAKKGVDLTLRAFARASAGGHARLRLIGDGRERPRLEALARELGIVERVEFLGMRTHEQYARDLAEADVFIHPSRYDSTGDGEGGAPTSLLEAQAIGLPVVATTHADIPFVTDPDAALLAPEDDVDALAAHLTHLLRSPHEWIERARAGRRLIERQHDAARLRARLESLYDEARAAGARSRGVDR